MGEIKKVSEGIYFGAKSGAIFEMESKTGSITDSIPSLVNSATDSAQFTQATDKSQGWAKWGSDNNFPANAQRLFSKNPATLSALNFKIKAHYGKGIKLCKKHYDRNQEVIEIIPFGDHPEIEDFFELNNIQDEYALESITDYEWFINIFPEFITNKEKTKINRIRHIETTDTRMGMINKETGLPDLFYISKKWPDPSDDVVKVPGYDPRNKTKYSKFIQQFCQPSVGKPYYQLAYWLGSEDWVRVQNKIPELLDSVLTNQMVLKYHVQVPFSYFDKLIRRENYDTDEKYLSAWETTRDTTMAAIDEQLSGHKNAGKNVFSMFGVDEQGNPIGEWKITVIEAPFQHEGYLTVYDTSMAAVASAHNVPLALAGIMFPGKMGAGSGAEIRESLNLYNQLHTPIPRAITLSPLRFIKKFNAWPKDVDFCYGDLDLAVPTYVDKSGRVPAVDTSVPPQIKVA